MYSSKGIVDIILSYLYKQQSISTIHRVKFLFFIIQSFKCQCQNKKQFVCEFEVK